MSPLGEVIMRLVKLGPELLVLVSTTLAATRSTFGVEVVRVPLLDVLLVPEVPTPPTRGLRASRPRYSRMRTSGKFAATLKRTVTTLPPAAAAAMLRA